MQIESETLIKVEESDLSEDGRFEIPQGVTKIDASAFEGNEELTAVTFSENLTHIGNEAFGCCIRLTTVTFNENLTHIGNKAFEYCINLTNITFNENLTHIGDRAFSGCPRLTNITFNKNLTHIGFQAFYCCDGLTAVTFNKNLTQIGNGAFMECHHLTSLAFNEKLSQIGNQAFYRCTSLTAVTFNENLTEIGTLAFYECTGLTALTFNEKLTQIGHFAFYGCTGLTTLTFNENLTQIGVLAFKGCTSLKKIIINTKDDANFNRIKNLLPEELRGICIKKSLDERLAGIKEVALKSILEEPATNSIRRTTKNATFTRDIWLLLNKHTKDSNVFYQKAKSLMDALDFPKVNDENSLALFSKACKKVCDDCLAVAKTTICKSPETLKKEFAIQLEIILDKVTALRNDGHKAAAKKAAELYNNLTEYSNTYFSKPIQETYVEFKKNSKDAIKDAHEELDKHRGWKRVLGNIGLAIFGFGILYVAAVLINRNVFFNKTDSSEKLDNLEKLFDNNSYAIS